MEEKPVFQPFVARMNYVKRRRIPFLSRIFHHRDGPWQIQEVLNKFAYVSKEIGKIEEQYDRQLQETVPPIFSIRHEGINIDTQDINQVYRVLSTHHRLTKGIHQILQEYETTDKAVGLRLCYGNFVEMHGDDEWDSHEVRATLSFPGLTNNDHQELLDLKEFLQEESWHAMTGLQGVILRDYSELIAKFR